MQIFIIQAIEYYSKLVVDTELNWPENYIISEEYWKSTAREAQYLMQMKCGGKNEAVQDMSEEEGRGDSSKSSMGQEESDVSMGVPPLHSKE